MNVVNIKGVIVSEFEYECANLYRVYVSIPRMNGTVSDVIPCLVREEMVDVSKNMIGAFVEVNGFYHSKNVDRKVVLYVFASEFYLVETLPSGRSDNRIEMRGTIVKKPVYRTTPFGKKITDIVVATHRPSKKSDYIPCVCWGRVAEFVKDLYVGDEVAIEGRIQSREYVKRLENGDRVVKTAYEVSVFELDLL